MITLTINAATMEEARAKLNAFFAVPPQSAPVVLNEPTTAAPNLVPFPQAPAAIPTAPAAPAAPAAPIVPIAPSAPAPTYTLNDISLAGSTLVDAGKMVELQQLLQSFGVRFVGELPVERYGEFATALRGLGAKL